MSTLKTAITMSPTFVVYATIDLESDGSHHLVDIGGRHVHLHLLKGDGQLGTVYVPAGNIPVICS